MRPRRQRAGSGARLKAAAVSAAAAFLSGGAAYALTGPGFDMVPSLPWLIVMGLWALTVVSLVRAVLLTAAALAAFVGERRAAREGG